MSLRRPLRLCAAAIAALALASGCRPGTKSPPPAEDSGRWSRGPSFDAPRPWRYVGAAELQPGRGRLLSRLFSPSFVYDPFLPAAWGRWTVLPRAGEGGGSLLVAVSRDGDAALLLDRERGRDGALRWRLAPRAPPAGSVDGASLRADEIDLPTQVARRDDRRDRIDVAPDRLVYVLTSAPAEGRAGGDALPKPTLEQGLVCGRRVLEVTLRRGTEPVSSYEFDLRRSPVGRLYTPAGEGAAAGAPAC